MRTVRALAQSVASMGSHERPRLADGFITRSQCSWKMPPWVTPPKFGLAIMADECKAVHKGFLCTERTRGVMAIGFFHRLHWKYHRQVARLSVDALPQRFWALSV
mmetsp:Transcript_75720/g.165203  ORF Transcript_75720/g.165203 Transcript_75720/m.165203 type:complete len:105 (+) Transcript_75720:2199-2513(+)